ncbi:pyridoxal phosphate-dependent aminotransferase [Falsiroseomonas selenitidurans]|uniref:Histidinol-phosphate aminotransferase n=1 Tax=Falsiroseomonas selenitidurans TaxID=2716335 RepID=A0ABX1E7R8_9PROT|nr:aminotransferase class I/II-fold pyridoxal phosphate-dependent enzyme [Falsiroseomonas selenitidurans]NKC33101.1 aminotransferase class I/II-fold pyridoxal phosphate-dependent enzyme [Falsiroseomonas selenitidurans]
MKAFALERLVPAHVRAFEAYVPAPPDDVLLRRFGVTHLHRLNNNENPLGPPPAARAVLARRDAGEAALYPQGDGWHLRRTLARHFDLEPEQVILGNGASEVIAFVIKTFCEPGDNILTADRTFAVYEWMASFSGIEPRLVPLLDHGFDDVGMLRAIEGRTRVVFLCNPNNPTGSWWDHARLARFLAAVDGRAIVVVDEAYAEFAEAPGFPDSFALMRQHPNLVVFRSFSKMWGLAGLRIGWMAASPPVAAMVRKTSISYSVNLLALEAARATVWDLAHIAATQAHCRAMRAGLAALAGRLGLEMLGGIGNFAMLRMPIPDTVVHRRLMARGVMARAMTSFRYAGWLRVSFGDAEAMAAFAAALEAVLAEG